MVTGHILTIINDGIFIFDRVKQTMKRPSFGHLTNQIVVSKSERQEFPPGPAIFPTDIHVGASPILPSSSPTYISHDF